MTKYFVLTGDPGVGKTTIIKKLNLMLSKKNVKLAGFYTEEVKQNRARQGFDVVSFDGKRGCLARDTFLLNAPADYHVGKYGVMIKEFENIALPSLNKEVDTNLYVIDEIGKMELFSKPFKSRLTEIFSPNSNYFVLATIPSRSSDSLIENVRNNNKTKIWMVNRENRNTIHDNIFKEITEAMGL